MIKLKHLLPECNECGRDWNHGHDHEAGMAKNELRDMISNASKIDNMVGEGDNLPGWVSAYISLAADYMHSVSEYLAGETSRSQEPGPGYSNSIVAEHGEKEVDKDKAITVVNDLTAHDSTTGEKLKISAGSKVKVLIKRLPNEPTVMQLSYKGKKVNVNAGPFINQYLYSSMMNESIDLKKVKAADAAIVNLIRNISTNYNIPKIDRTGIVRALKELQEFIDEVGLQQEVIGSSKDRSDKGRKHSSKTKDYGLDYIPKSDYRVGTQFHHKQYGTGTIAKADPKYPYDQNRAGHATLFVNFVNKDEHGNNVVKNIKLVAKLLKPDQK